MRAKLVNEKFTDKNDPIKDLGIGGMNSIKKGDKFKIKKEFVRVFIKNLGQCKYELNDNNINYFDGCFADNLIMKVLNVKKDVNYMTIKFIFFRVNAKERILVGTRQNFNKYFEIVR